MTKINSTAVRTALVLGITLGSAGTMTAVSVPLTAYDAQAFGLSDITGAAKKVGKGVAKGAKKVGGAAYKAHKTVRRAKKAVRDFGRDAVGQAHVRPVYGLAEGLDYTISKARGTYDAEEHEKRWRNAEGDIGKLVDAANSYNGVKDRVKRKIIDSAQDAARKTRDKLMTGKLTPVPPRNPGYRPGQWGQNGNPLAQGLVNRTPKNRAPVQSIPLERTKPGAGLTSRITLQKGKPAGRNTVPLAQKGSTAPVQGITKENLKPARGQTPKVTRQGRPVGKATTKTLRKGETRNVPGHQGSKTPQERKRTYPNYPPKRDYPNYPGNKVGGNLTKQGKAVNDRSLAGRPVGGRKPIGNDRSLAGRPVGGKKPIGNDRSIWGRPVGGKKPIGQDRSKVRRPAGITRENLQPRRKSKQIQKSQPRQKTFQLKQGKPKFTRDLSRKSFGGGSNTKTKHWRGKVRKKAVPLKSQGSRKSMKRGNSKRSFNNRGRRGRRG